MVSRTELEVVKEKAEKTAQDLIHKLDSRGKGYPITQQILKTLKIILEEDSMNNNH